MFVGLRHAADRARTRRNVRRNDAGSMPIALLVTFVGVGLSALLSNMVVSQIRTTHHSADRVQAVDAAQAGLDVALAGIRAAYDAAGGDRRKLPCGPITGTVDPADTRDAARYEVSVDYYISDPSGYQDNLAAIAANRVTCGGSGTATVPAYALLRSRGTGAGDLNHDGIIDPNAGPWRSLYATYTFFTTTENIPGGDIRIANTPDRQCLGATSKTSTVNNYLIARLCDDSADLTTWLYPKNLTLVLAASRTAARPDGLCAHAPSQADGMLVKLTPCVTPTDFHQQWRFAADFFTYMGTADGVADSGFCFNMQTPDMVNSRVLLREHSAGGHCDNSPTLSSRNFFPDRAVGAGASGADTGQLVNRGEVGRCIDLPRDDVNGKVFTDAGRLPALITYPCKQAFNGIVHWNHKFAMPPLPAASYKATGHIAVTPGDVGDPGYGVAYCLESPGSAPGNVWVDKCSTGGTALNWTMFQRAPLIEDSYQIADAYGNCMQSVGPAATAAQRLDAWSFVITKPCDGSDLQKWNVPASFSAGPLKALGEK